MKNLVRGVLAFSILGVFVAVIYAQARTENKLNIAKDPQTKQINSFIDSEQVNQNVVTEDPQIQDQDKDKAKKKVDPLSDTGTTKLVEKTVSSKAAGVSRGMFTATAYCLRGRTAMGHGVRKGLIAADPRVLRLGSRVNLGAGAYSGNYLVSDTGGRIKGRKIDIWMSSCSEARRFGRRSVSISAVN
jgi:3D (Asp-Asp-Asp) domain-containing protein